MIPCSMGLRSNPLDVVHGVHVDFFQKLITNLDSCNRKKHRSGVEHLERAFWRGASDVVQRHLGGVMKTKKGQNDFVARGGSPNSVFKEFQSGGVLGIPNAQTPRFNIYNVPTHCLKHVVISDGESWPFLVLIKGCKSY